MSTKDEVESLIDKLFSEIESEALPESDAADPHIYPEQLLHMAPQGNKYYHALQQYKRQFLDDSLEGRVIGFSHSNLNNLQRQKVGSWDGHAVEITEKYTPSKTIPSLLKTANALFAWSSGDDHIRARKEELQSRSGSPAPVSSPTRPLSVNKSRTPSFPVRLHQIVEKESNKFIQDRINLIEAHRLEQASKRVSERKQRDHDRYLERMRKKEEEDSKALNAAIKLKRESKNQNFFGTLFSFAKTGKHTHPLEESGSTLDLNTITSSKSSMDSTSVSKSPSVASIGAHSPNVEANRPVTPTADTFKAASLTPTKPNTLALQRGKVAGTQKFKVEPEPEIVGIDDAFSTLGKASSTSSTRNSGIDDLLGLLSTDSQNVASPPKHKFIPLGSVPKKKIENDGDDKDGGNLLQL